MQLTTDDRAAGLEAPDGRSFRPDSNGVITLPDELESYGRRAARVVPMFHRRRPLWAGFDDTELRARRAAWEAARGERGAESIHGDAVVAGTAEQGANPDMARLGPDGEAR